ncbi:MAG: hypothetical protein JSR73_02880 [Proteobacteria bacterium]|nr:hypothetical protein [Pseudomonadota bacterium]
MANQLRWILLGIGLVLIAGLWWWERRRASAPAEESAKRSADRFEPRLDGEAGGAHPPAEPAPAAAPPGYGPPMRASEERPVPHGDPPLVTLDDLPENTESVVLAPEELPAMSATPPPLVPERRRPRPDAPPPEERVMRVEPRVERPERSERLEPVVEPPAAPAKAEPEPPTRQQRIVAIRLIGGEHKIGGGDLKRALAGEGLEFGRYSIFHRLGQGTRPIYSVASLVEPGSFDTERMDGMGFPGISLFAVFPGPLPAPQAFDEMLATARRLAERLDGVLQDDAGSSLTGQRVLSIREELVHFEHLVSLSRSRPGA